MTPTPEECHRCAAPKRNYQEHSYPYWQFYECGAKHSSALGEWAYGDTASCLRRQLAASQERVRELEAENVALRANTSASVVRRLVEQGAIRGPELPAVWKAATLREIARKISEVTFSEKWEKHAAFLVQLADDFDAESPA